MARSKPLASVEGSAPKPPVVTVHPETLRHSGGLLSRALASDRMPALTGRPQSSRRRR